MSACQRELISGMILLFVFLYFLKLGMPYFPIGETKAVQRMATELYLLIQGSNKLKALWLSLPQTEQGRQEV